MTEKRIYANVQLLRFIAASLVIFVHISPYFVISGVETDSFISVISFSHGGFGVDVFFVISGFVIAATTLHKSRELGEGLHFARKRGLRIYLGYLPFLVWALIQTYFLEPERFARLDIVGSIFLTQTNIFKNALGVSWSLTYELYFYMIFTSFFFLSRRNVVFIIHILFAVILTKTLFFEKGSSAYLNFLFSPFLLEFLAGSILFIHMDRLNGRIWLIVCLVAIYLTISSDLNPFESVRIRVLRYAPAAVALVMMAVLLEKWGAFRCGATGVLLGDASYTLYLCHGLILQLGFQLVLLPLQFTLSTPILLLLTFATFCLVIIFSIIFYRAVEMPLYKWALKKSRPVVEGLIQKPATDSRPL